jgi:acyl-[acyl-carrier-protein] desaturase
VARRALLALGIDSIKAIEAGLRQTRSAPTPEGAERPAPTFPGCDFGVVASAVQRLFGYLNDYEREIGLADIDPLEFAPYSWENGGEG